MGGLKISYHDVISTIDEFFLPMGSKPYNTD